MDMFFKSTPTIIIIIIYILKLAFWKMTQVYDNST